MPIIKAYQIPHGSQNLDPENYPWNGYKGFQKLQDACITVAKDIFEAQPDLIFFITPHGLELSYSHAIYTNHKASGNVDDTDEYKNYTACVDIDYEKSLELLKIFNTTTSVPVEGITAHDPTDNNIEIKAGEVVPIWFLNSSLCFMKKQPKYIFFSLTRRRYQQDEKMVGEMLQAGSTIYNYLESLKERVAIVISADLAHSHLITYGPCKGQQPYPVSKEAEPFDKYIAKWASDPLNEKAVQGLLVDADKILDQALSCGYLGLVALSAIFQKYENYWRQQVGWQKAKESIKSQLLECLHPTYFGMAVAIFDFVRLK